MYGCDSLVILLLKHAAENESEKDSILSLFHDSNLLIYLDIMPLKLLLSPTALPENLLKNNTGKMY